MKTKSMQLFFTALRIEIKSRNMNTFFRFGPFLPKVGNTGPNTTSWTNLKSDQKSMNTLMMKTICTSILWQWPRRTWNPCCTNRIQHWPFNSCLRIPKFLSEKGILLSRKVILMIPILCIRLPQIQNVVLHFYKPA